VRGEGACLVGADGAHEGGGEDAGFLCVVAGDGVSDGGILFGRHFGGGFGVVDVVLGRGEKKCVIWMELELDVEIEVNGSGPFVCVNKVDVKAKLVTGYENARSGSNAR
jgi:hypothetical protein